MEIIDVDACAKCSEKETCLRLLFAKYLLKEVEKKQAIKKLSDLQEARE